MGRRRVHYLSDRQIDVAVQLYTTHGWSARLIGLASGVGRRSVEIELKARGIPLTHRGFRIKRQSVIVDIPYETGRDWLADAGRPTDSQPPKPLTFAVEDAHGVMRFRRRRCQSCWLLTEYADACPRCGRPLNPGPNDEESDDG